MRKEGAKLAFILILLLAAFLRFYQLGFNPSSLDWDEASLGYNAYHLLKTGTDEYGERWPLAIRSFGDYKPPMYVYLTIPTVAVFGLNEMAVRLPSALLGVLTVAVTFFLTQELFGKRNLAFLSMFFLAISPWHLQFSRVAFEANVGLFFFVTAVWLFLRGVKDGPFLILSAVSFGLSFYSYHSPRLVAPLLLIGFAWYFRKQLWQKKKYCLLAFFAGALVVFPLVVLFFSGSGQERFSIVSIFSAPDILTRSIRQIEHDMTLGFPFGFLIHNRRIIYTFAFIKGCLDHLNFNFLFLRGDGFGRHQAPDMGMLYLWDFPFLLLGIYWLLKEKGWGAFPLFWWFLVAPVASGISASTPHAVRALLYLPAFQVMTAYGFLGIFRLVSKNGLWQRGLLIIMAIALAVNVSYYLHQYYVHLPINCAQSWLYGYKQMIAVVNHEEKHYDKILVTNFYDQPYVFFLFYNQLDPYQYKNNGTDYLGFGKYEFRRVDWDEDQSLEDTLIVGSGAEIPETVQKRLRAQIDFPDGEVAFRIIGKEHE